MLPSRRSECGRQSCLSTLETASPSSTRWADISDAESDTDGSVCDDSFFSTSLKSQLEPELGAVAASSTPSTLNAGADEFVPTLSMECQVIGVVGYCYMISEDYPLDAHSNSEGSSSYQTYNVPEQAAACVRKTRKQRPKKLEIDAVVAASSQERDINTQRRMKNIAVGKETKEYQWHAEQLRLHGACGAEPLTPDPADNSISKRAWDSRVSQWRSELRRQYEMRVLGNRLSELSFSAASTEVDSYKSSERDDSTNASDDGSTTM